MSYADQCAGEERMAQRSRDADRLEIELHALTNKLCQAEEKATEFAKGVRFLMQRFRAHGLLQTEYTAQLEMAVEGWLK